MPDITTLVVHDGDNGSYARVFVDGVEVHPQEIVIDAGRGWDWNDWVDHRDWCLAWAREAGDDALSAVEAALSDPPGWKYIDDVPDHLPDFDWLTTPATPDAR